MVDNLKILLIRFSKFGPVGLLVARVRLPTTVRPHVLEIVQDGRRENAFLSEGPDSSAIGTISEWLGMRERPLVVLDPQQIQKLGSLLGHEWLEEDTGNSETFAGRENDPVNQGLRVRLLDYNPGFRVGDEGVGLGL